MRTKQKRNLFGELKQGMDEIHAHKSGKITLRTFDGKRKPRPTVSANIIRNTRQKLHMSRAVFAITLRVSPRTLEKWELGQTIPNDQAAALILMVRKFPDTLQRLMEI